ncbi:LacI family DNA-binding transcriptional regulator [Jonesia denitrificans]|uniref:Periplasmic binding protein/LacI transcriptional regulator n=1 Tax=Jonesia denitrificans (strain ATCC 14870 / DSM 20603 / BCRC 15368 / CIP 55.134 / JCM 11481 / NBRC 15587 / NCTC 10816 / Prevot 55134) TaxID=471856 RepID=C7QZA0_JONDD|nr:substrate-binding domain-containing protein [Jonesia denitrificans]ACV09398.1 periplasmic binding protein/LacI transcriptional regulator [Jonesia denitrificans DSM 20603]ASE09359.1 LacI family transcriptional regulator [Jonesia denitrificans]QXB43899.1 substrate-binding domain-containing protein [Jonesia denitrificans]SQH21712.1 HTH-type transcriptional repressor CytR [Jonesia denitrificans]
MVNTVGHLDSGASDAALFPQGAIGLIRTAPRRMVTVEPFFMEFIAGVESELTPLGVSVLLAVVEDVDAECETYRRWASMGMVDAVLVVNIHANDPRPHLLHELGIPAVLVGQWSGPPEFPSVTANDAAAMTAVFSHLAEGGHRKIAHITGPAQYAHTQQRCEVLDVLARQRGIRVLTFEGDYSDTSGELLTTEALASDPPPTALIFDNDVMAVAGLHAVRSAGKKVPDDVAIVGWDDSPLCRLTEPPLTTATLDIFAMGQQAARSLVTSLKTGDVGAPTLMTATLNARGSTRVPQ